VANFDTFCHDENRHQKSLFESMHTLAPASSTWLACPVTAEHTQAYWQWLGRWRQQGLETVLWPGLTPQADPVLACQALGLHGLMLWADDPMSQTWGEQARRQGLRVQLIHLV
jgi:hypothetical protein